MLQYTQLNYLMRNGGEGQNVLLVIFVLLVVLALLLLIVLGFAAVKLRRQQSMIAQLVFKGLALAQLLAFTIFPILIFNALFSVASCSADNPATTHFDCSSGTYGALRSSAVCLGVLAFLSQQLLVAFGIDLCPYSKLYLGCISNRINQTKFVAKLALSLYFALDHAGSGSEAFVLVYLAYSAMLLGYHLYFQDQYNRSTYKFMISCEAVVVWAYLSSAAAAYSQDQEDDTVRYYYFLLGGGVIFYLSYRALRISNHTTLLNAGKSAQRNIYRKFQIFNAIQYLIDNRQQETNYQVLMGFLTNHIFICDYKKGVCPGTIIFENKGKLAPEEEYGLWSQFLFNQIMKLDAQYNKVPMYHLLVSYILFHKIQNKLKAVIQLYHAQVHNPNPLIQFNMYCQKMEIEKQQVTEHLKHTGKKTANV